MRRQTILAETTAPEREGSAQGLDPFCLPARTTIDFDPSSRFEDGGDLYLDRTRIILKARLKSGFPLTLTVPISSFRHVAVDWDSAKRDDNMVIRLVHKDPSLTLTLCRYDNAADAAMALKGWARILNLSSVCQNPDGTEQVIEDRIGMVVVKPVQPRRMHSYFAARRPRFLVRRKTGQPGHFPVYGEREIIARD